MHVATRDYTHRGKVQPHPVPVQERILRLPEALLLTAGYYASRAPAVAELLRRRP